MDLNKEYLSQTQSLFYDKNLSNSCLQVNLIKVILQYLLNYKFKRFNASMAGCETWSPRCADF